MSTPNPSELFSPFLPSTFNVPEEEDRLNPYLGDKFSQFSDVINDKRIGGFTQDVETQNGQKIAYDVVSKVRSGYQFLARIKSYPANGTIVLPIIFINSQFRVFQVWGSASKPPTTPGTGDYITYVNQGNPKIFFTFTDQSITVTTVGLGTGYDGFIIIDYIKDGE